MTTRTSSKAKTKKQYFIHIPPILVNKICEQMKLDNPPSEEDLEVVVHWCVAGSLAGSIFDDTMIEEGTTKKTMKKLSWELKWYLKEMRGKKE